MTTNSDKDLIKFVEKLFYNYESIKKEISYIQSLLDNQHLINATEKAYLISLGEVPSLRIKSEEDIQFVESFLKNPSIMNNEYMVPCIHHVENAEVCEAYGVHMSRCPLICSDNGCAMLDTGIPKESHLEERFNKWLQINLPEVINEISKYLRSGELPSPSLLKIVIDSKHNFGMQKGKEYLELMKNKNTTSKTKRKPIPTRLRFEVLKRDKFKCQYCGRGVEDDVKLHVDHIVPYSKGGADTLDNFKTACQDCNLGKSDIEI
ncbi:HNH endonuclease [Heyndrickxia oleronia]|uniref:HNH endonuclease n=1 Tax=Heyndrickxia oleronia TaxID=38875 RepID=UPI001C0E9347|nr:HNH endonuclease [Heyndrickxia oleronia]MBU5214374.1 HNH endonuclease [Heyndrickxia oleronia]